MFLDTLPFFKRHFKELLTRDPATQPFNLGNLYQYVFKEPLPDAHDAVADVGGLRRLILAVNEPFSGEACNHLVGFIDDRRPLIDLKWVGKTRANRIEEYMQHSNYVPEGQRQVRSLRAFFKKRGLEALEDFLRTQIRIQDDGSVLSIMSQVMRVPTWEMPFPAKHSFKAMPGIPTATDFACLYYFDCAEDKDAMVKRLEGMGATRKTIARLVKRFD